jgi:ABC-type amino acid transport substrate-binding protein
MTNRTKLILAGIVLLLVSVPALTVLLLRRAPKDASLEHMQQTGVLRVGMDAAYPPFEWIDEQNQLVGLDVDLANEIGKRLGVRMEFSNIAYDGLYDALYTRKVDVLISGLVNAREFWGKASFSQPYFNMGEQIVILNRSDIGNMEDMAGKTAAVEVGSGGDVEARKWQRRIADFTVTRYPDANAALAAVLNGEADAALVDGVTARLGTGEHAELRIAGSVADTLVAAAVHPESPALKALVDQALNQIAQDGTLDSLINKWFGSAS